MEVEGISPARVKEVENASVVSGQVDASGNLVLVTKGGQQKNAGTVVKPLFSWPVGSIYIGVSSTNPADLFGGGTWERFAKGRVLVGIEENDPSFAQPLGVAGAKTHKLTAAESGLPSHNHAQDAHDHATNNLGSGGQAVVGDYSAAFRLGIPGDGGTAYGASGTVYGIDVQPATATNQPAAAQNAASEHNNLQPYINVYMWRRTA